MKYVKLIFILILGFSPVPVLSGRQFLFAAEPFKAELYADSDKTIGTKVQIPFSETRASIKEDSVNFGFAFFTKNLFPPLPLTVKTGNLSGGGALTKLANPTLSASSSPFSTGLSSVNALTASLPSYTSFSKPQSSFVQLEYPVRFKNGSTIKSLVNLWLSPDAASPVYSTQFSTELAKRKLTLDFSAIYGIFNYDAAESSSWITDQAYYKAGQHQCSILQFSCSYKTNSQAIFKTAFTSGFYESPFGTLPINLRADLSFQNKKVEAFASAFYNPQEDLITSSQKSIPSCVQLKSGIITKKLTAPFQNLLIIKTGFNVMATINFVALEHPVIANAGIQFSDNLMTLSFTSSLKASVSTPPPSLSPQFPDFDSLLLQVKNKWDFKILSPSAELAVTFSEKKDEPAQKYKISAGLSGGKKHTFSGTASVSFSYAQKEISSKKYSATLTARLQFRYLTITGKVSVSLE